MLFDRIYRVDRRDDTVNCSHGHYTPAVVFFEHQKQRQEDHAHEHKIAGYEHGGYDGPGI